MSVQAKVFVTLADGKKRALYYSYKALRLIREKHGISFQQKIGWEKCDEVVLPELIQIGIEGAVKKLGLPQSDALTVDEVADLMDGEQTNEYFATVIRAGNGQNVLDAFIALKNVNSRSETAAETTTQTTSSDPS